MCLMFVHVIFVVIEVNVKFICIFLMVLHLFGNLFYVLKLHYKSGITLVVYTVTT
jgi:hypothetical protein